MVTNGLQVPTWKSYGQRAYEAYRIASGGSSLISGDPIPEWDQLEPKIQKAWAAAASAVISGEAPR
jgi:hypothetical protein